MRPVRTILHPTDFSECSHCAFEVALQLARSYRGRLVVLHAASGESLCFGDASLAPQAENAREEIELRFGELRRQAGDVPVDTRLVQGDPAAAIVEAAEQIPCDLIVLGTHGRGGWGNLLMGSVAREVARRAGGPVTMVHLPHRKGGDTAATS